MNIQELILASSLVKLLKSAQSYKLGIEKLLYKPKQIQRKPDLMLLKDRLINLCRYSSMSEMFLFFSMSVLYLFFSMNVLYLYSFMSVMYCLACLASCPSLLIYLYSSMSVMYSLAWLASCSSLLIYLYSSKSVMYCLAWLASCPSLLIYVPVLLHECDVLLGLVGQLSQPLLL